MSLLDIYKAKKIGAGIKLDDVLGEKYGIVDLGTLTWVASSTTNCFYSQNASTPKYAIGDAPMICAKYECTGGRSASPFYGADKTLQWYYRTQNDLQSELYVHDSSFSDAASFKEAMSGVYLVYKKA